jgi:hypothetical protein
MRRLALLLAAALPLIAAPRVAGLRGGFRAH